MAESDKDKNRSVDKWESRECGRKDAAMPQGGGISLPGIKKVNFEVPVTIYGNNSGNNGRLYILLYRNFTFEIIIFLLPTG